MAGDKPLRERPWRRGYSTAAVIVLNSLIGLCAANLVCGWIIHFRASGENPYRLYGKQRILPAYPSRTPADVEELLHETWDEVDRYTVYDEFTGFREGPHRGRFVNVDPAGFRVSTPQAKWPPDSAAFNVFVFGGSTTFGLGVADSETLPSAIQARLPNARVYNFGRSSYYSTPEMLLYYRLLIAGARPRVAIFVDGLNEFANMSGHLPRTPYLTSLVDQDNWGDGLVAGIRRMFDRAPLGRAARFAREKILRHPGPPPENDRADEATLAWVRDRWMANRALIETLSARFGVQPLFVWQPVPTYRYDAKHYHLLGEVTGSPWTSVTPGYELVAQSRAQMEEGGDFLWLADMQAERHENLYVDHVHYRPEFMRDIADRICTALRDPTAPVAKQK